MKKIKSWNLMEFVFAVPSPFPVGTVDSCVESSVSTLGLHTVPPPVPSDQILIPVLSINLFHQDM